MSTETSVAIPVEYLRKPPGKFGQDLAHINTRQQEFNEKLGIKEKVHLNYNPVLARANYERITSGSRRQNFRNYELWQVQTSIRERHHAAKSSVNHLIDENGEIRNELFPDEPFLHVLQRGLEYQEQNGSREIAREQSEVEGWMELCNVLKNPNTPINTKAIVISPPGIVEGTNYRDNFIDIYEALDDEITGKRYIKMTRNASKLNYGDYENIAPQLQPGYFDGVDGPIDAWYLRNPIYKNPRVDARSADEIFEQIFGHREGTMSEKEFQELWTMLTPVAMYYIDILCQEEFDPVSLAISWNAVLKKSDLISQVLDVIKNPQNFSTLSQIDNIPKFYGNIHEEINWLGRQKIDMIAAACGPSGGFKIENKDGIIQVDPALDFLSNSVGKFGVEKDHYGSLHFDCPHCHKDNKREHGKLITKCQNCRKDVTCGDENKDKTSITK